ncbi:thiamine biosynthesis ATP pyrophosphatase [Thermoplasmatales archaeon SCGC AB-540-F20]|nr:thiamine biosynthesis ATP pyrophosphatase [Thermoplasmatales archaeon SCGC AB-540-F20]
MRRGCKILFANIDEHNTKILNSFLTNWYANLDIFMVDTKGENLYESLNKIASERNCDAIVTGHTLCNNPQNELSDIKLLKKHINLPILHPLIAMGDGEISQKCKEIGIPI